MFRPLLVVASTAFAQTDYSKLDQQRQIDDQQMKIDHLHSELQQQEFRAEGDAIIATQQNRAAHQADQSQKSAAELDEEARRSAGMSRADWEARKPPVSTLRATSNGRNSPIESTRSSIYFPIGAGAGVTTSLCCAQAPSSKAVTRTATIMIIFRNFNLSRLLSSRVAPFRLGGEPRRSNAFLHFFEPSQIGRPGRRRARASYGYVRVESSVILV